MFVSRVQGHNQHYASVPPPPTPSPPHRCIMLNHTTYQKSRGICKVHNVPIRYIKYFNMQAWLHRVWRVAQQSVAWLSRFWRGSIGVRLDTKRKCGMAQQSATQLNRVWLGSRVRRGSKECGMHGAMFNVPRRFDYRPSLPLPLGWRKFIVHSKRSTQLPKTRNQADGELHVKQNCMCGNNSVPPVRSNTNKQKNIQILPQGKKSKLPGASI